MNTSDDDNTLSEMSMSIRGKMARGDGEQTKGLANRLGKSAAPSKVVNDIELNGSKSNDEDEDDDDDEEEEEDEEQEDSDTQRDKLLHNDDANKNNKESKK